MAVIEMEFKAYRAAQGLPQPQVQVWLGLSSSCLEGAKWGIQLGNVAKLP